jgi:3alpha(or 20beta)-hydroxysteroid dehydrogenase
VSVVVTGAASGIGAAVAAVLPDVIALDIAAAEGVRPFDVTDEAAWAALLAEGLRGDPPRGLVHCAGTTWRARLGEVTGAAFAHVHAVNVLGPLLGIQALAPLMPPGSSIVVIGSLAGASGHGGAKSVSDALRKA